MCCAYESSFCGCVCHRKIGPRGIQSPASGMAPGLLQALESLAPRAHGESVVEEVNISVVSGL